MTEKELKELARQLRNPSGEFGKIVAQNMQEGNVAMTNHSVENLQIKGNQKVLEIGHGDAQHVSKILETHPESLYFGIDISPLMYEESIKNNQVYLQKKRADFKLYNGLTLPYNSNFFDRIFTVNTIYFWDNPEVFLDEIFRVCKHKTRFCLTFGDADFMKSLPFTAYGFQLHPINTITDWCVHAGFSIETIQTTQDKVISKSGDKVNRLFHTIVLEAVKKI